jgi:hypothetical protein
MHVEDARKLRRRIPTDTNFGCGTHRSLNLNPIAAIPTRSRAHRQQARSIAATCAT